MNSGKKFQKMSGKKRMMLMLCIVTSIGILLGSLNIAKKKNFINENNMFDVLKKQPGLVVNRYEENNFQNDLSFNLGAKSYFGNLQAIKKVKSGYGFSDSTEPKVVKEVYKMRVNENLSIFKRLELSNQEIKEANYVIERDILPLLDEKEFTKKYPSSFENRYIKGGLKKIKITFNKKFLPIKIDGYFEDEKGAHWGFLRHISYPYKNKAEFNGELKDYIDLIQDIEREDKAEEEAEKRD